MIALPGLIDTHSHLWNTPLRNLVDEGPKMGYFALTLALGKEYTPEDTYRGVRLGVGRDALFRDHHRARLVPQYSWSRLR